VVELWQQLDGLLLALGFFEPSACVARVHYFVLLAVKQNERILN
jgi:hypothetical protein